MTTFIDLIFNSLRFGSIVALATLGIVLIFRTSRTTNFAQGSIGTLGAYFAAWLMQTRGTGIGITDSIWVASLAAIIFGFFVGIIIDFFIIRRVGENPLSKQIITLGLILLFLGLIPQSWAFGAQGYSSLSPSYFSGHMTILGSRVSYNVIFFITLTVVLMTMTFLFIQKTRWGLATRVTASNTQTARLMGVPTNTVTMMSWAVAAMMGTMAGLMIGQSAVRLDMLVTIQVTAFFAATFGGFQTFYGPIIAAFIISFARYTLNIYVTDTWDQTIVWVSILAILYFKPYGLFGKAPEKKV